MADQSRPEQKTAEAGAGAPKPVGELRQGEVGSAEFFDFVATLLVLDPLGRGRRWDVADGVLYAVGMA